ncbi:cytochrome c oxidase subunit 3 [Sulfoacidibacillus thermotolerans]|uniref:Heme-copper oxidase subunit III family profile domain-containing protein n=1 Tax=Sulfoacidibacillus thermotolerans TaxID=1765684 RepID=A0A2U3D7Y5_SULT2|nr:cytochrome c oxidase subunit 3 [Sulfoacidibacillus thermotolerans]PWI57404.1 hypothetical protein BM613_08750 [Sulfoacidibacillus thermotolerans]
MAARTAMGSAQTRSDVESRIEQRKMRSAFAIFLFSMSVPYFMMINVRYIMSGGFIPPALDQTTGAIQTVLLVISLLTAVAAVRRVQQGDGRGYKRMTDVTLFLGGVGTLMQGYELWYHPLNPMSHYGETFLATVGLSVVMGLVGLLVLAAGRERVKRIGVTPERQLGYELSSWYWVFTVITWVALYVELYLL